MNIYERISDGDIQTFFSGTLISYKGKPVFVESTSVGKGMYIRYLEDGKPASIKWSPANVKPISGRIGMVNVKGSCVYVSRKPIRRFQIGIDKNNTSVVNVGPRGQGHVRPPASIVSEFSTPYIADAIAGNYPTLEEAFLNATKFNGTTAFDKQFAVDYEGYIYYKDKAVGRAGKNLIKEAIKFKDNFYHVLLLGEKNAEDFRKFRPD